MRIKKKAQATVEFTFALIVIFFITYGLIKVFRWSGFDLAERRWAHETLLTSDVPTEQQLRPDFYRSKRINSVYRGWQN